MITLNKAALLLKQMDAVIILTHQYPDGDTLGSGFALCRLLRAMGKKANVLVCGDLPLKFAYMARGLSCQPFEGGHVVSVDVADVALLGENRGQFSGRVELCIDHHASNKAFAKYIYVDGTAAATAEIIYQLAQLLGVEIDQETADCIFTGIATDTGCFRYANTTPRTHHIAAQMMERGARAADINRVMFDTKSRRRIRIEKSVLETMEFYAQGRCAVVCITNQMMTDSGATEDETEGLSSLPRQVEGVCIGITVKQKEDGGYKISVRTTQGYNAGALCAQFGGGGHQAAAGCSMTGTLAQVKEQIVQAACKMLENHALKQPEE